MDFDESSSFIKDDMLQRTNSNLIKDDNINYEQKVSKTMSFKNIDSRGDIIYDDNNNTINDIQDNDKTQTMPTVPNINYNNISDDIIKQFKCNLNLFFAFFCFQCYIPQILIHIIKRSINFSDFFFSHIWLYCILVPIFITIVLCAYFSKTIILKPNRIPICIPFFLAYLIDFNLIIFFSAFYSDLFTLSLTTILFITYVAFFITNKMDCFDNKPSFVLTIGYVIVFIGFIVYSFCFNEFNVGFFICLIVFCSFIHYDVSRFNNILIEFVSDYKFDAKKDITILIYVYAFLYSHVDLFVCSFK